MNFENGGGTERVTSVVANGLSERGYKVSVVSCRNGENCRFNLDDSVQLYSLHGEQIKNGAFRKLCLIRKLKDYVNNHHVDILIAVDVALYLYLWPLQKQHLCKCIAWEHFNYYIAPNKMVAFARKLAAQDADCVVVLGKSDYKNYKDHFKNIKRLEYIYNPLALDLTSVSPLKEKRVIAVGRLNQQKGFDMLIDAWKIVESQNKEWRLDIFGEGELKEKLQTQINELGLKNVSLCGYAKNIEKEYLNSSIFVLASRYEGFVLVLLEAQAKGLPCVSFNCKEGPSEIIDDGVNGYLVEAGNVKALAENLLKLIESNELREKFGSMAQKDLYRFDIENVMPKWERLIDSL